MLDLNSLRNAAAKPSGRRVHHRRKFDSSHITIDLGFTRATLNDLSESGMAVRTSGPLRLQPGEQLQISLPDVKRPVEATCQLAWTAPSGISGLRFLVLAQGSQRSIREWLTCEEPCAQSWRTEASTNAPVINAPAPIASPAPPTPVAVALVDIPPMVNPSFDLSHGLQMIVELVQLLTHADGAALALRDRDQMVCRATIGSAPGIGAVVRSDSGLSGECMRTGLTVRSDDTSTDPRVDAEACRALNVGSIAVTPVFRDDSTHGILEILGRRPNTFTHIDIALLPQMAALVARLVSREKADRANGSGPGSLATKANGDSKPISNAVVAEAKTDLPPASHKGRSYVPSPEEPGQGTIRIAPGAVGNA
jgi:putative methionine-R-sulfoxide reductase with GAF domain